MMDIAGFYKTKSVFVTGGTGFLGKVLVEKLLRSCPGLGKVYLLIRGTDKSSARERLLDLQSGCEVFQRVRSECPEALSKLVAVDGDITLPGLGLSDQDTQEVIQNVSVVFHVAATVRFNETLRNAAKINFYGTMHTVELAKRIMNLKAFVYVSTAYSNINKKFIDEVIYQPYVTPSEFIDILQKYDDDQLDKMTPELLKDLPNTYIFTKQVTEAFLSGQCQELPIIITRPAVVTAAWKEPFPGWIDSMVGLTTMILLIGQGLLTTVKASVDYPAEGYPVDVAANLVIVAAWDIAQNEPERRSKIRILNGVSSPINPFTRTYLIDICTKMVDRYPVGFVYRYPGCTVTTKSIVYKILFFFQHYLLAWFVDCYYTARGEKPKLVDLCKKLYRNLERYSFILTSENVFFCYNVLSLQSKLSAQDKEVFTITVEDLNWDKYVESYAKGIRRYILKESEDQLPEARRQIKRAYYITKIVHTTLLVALGALLWKTGFFHAVFGEMF